MTHANARPALSHPARRPPWLRRVPGAIAAVALLGAAAASHAEALAIELPSMRTPIEVVPTAPALAPQAAGTVADPTAAAATPGADRLPEPALTRREVRETLKRARAANIVSPTHDLGDTPDVLAAREAYYALQTEAIVARYAAEQREQELRAALDADVQLRQALLDETVAAVEGDTSDREAPVVAAAPALPQADPMLPPAEDAALADNDHVIAMREHELEVTPETTVAEVMGYMDETGATDESLTLVMAEAGEADAEE